MRVEHSTGGNALAYDPGMRNTLVPLPFLLILLACGDDSEPTRPQDGTVAAWESCVWDGQQVPALCEPELACSSHGVCSPSCEAFDECPKFEGFDMECHAQLCIPRCNEADECPKTGGVELHCHQFQCIGDS